MTTYENAKVHFRPTNPEDPDDDGYAPVYDEVHLLPNGWIACGTSSTYGPQVFPPERIDEVDAGYLP